MPRYVRNQRQQFGFGIGGGDKRIQRFLIKLRVISLMRLQERRLLAGGNAFQQRAALHRRIFCFRLDAGRQSRIFRRAIHKQTTTRRVRQNFRVRRTARLLPEISSDSQESQDEKGRYEKGDHFGHDRRCAMTLSKPPVVLPQYTCWIIHKFQKPKGDFPRLESSDSIVPFRKALVPRPRRADKSASKRRVIVILSSSR